MGRRGNGEESITRRKDGLYMARFTVHTESGPKRRAVTPRPASRRRRSSPRPSPTATRASSSMPRTRPWAST